MVNDLTIWWSLSPLHLHPAPSPILCLHAAAYAATLPKRKSTSVILNYTTDATRHRPRLGTKKKEKGVTLQRDCRIPTAGHQPVSVRDSKGGRPALCNQQDTPLRQQLFPFAYQIRAIRRRCGSCRVAHAISSAQSNDHGPYQISTVERRLSPELAYSEH